MSFLRRLIPGLPGRDDDSDEEREGEALLEHEDYSSSESESSSNQEEAMDNGGIVQDEDASDHEAAMSVDEEFSSGRDTEAQAQDQARGESSKKWKNQKKSLIFHCLLSIFTLAS